MTRLNKSNDCATIDEVIKPSLIKRLKEALEAISRSGGFGKITITVERGRPFSVDITTSKLVKDE